MHPLGRITTHIVQAAVVGGETTHRGRDDIAVCIAIQDAPGDQGRGIVGHVDHRLVGRKVLAPREFAVALAFHPGGKGPLGLTGQSVAGAGGVVAVDDALGFAIERRQTLLEAQPVTEPRRLLPTDTHHWLVLPVQAVAFYLPAVVAFQELPELGIGGLGSGKVKGPFQFHRM